MLINSIDRVAFYLQLHCSIELRRTDIMDPPFQLLIIASMLYLYTLFWRLRYSVTGDRWGRMADGGQFDDNCPTILMRSW